MSRAAHVADVVFWLDQLGLAPVCVVGQSLGGHTAFLVAARHPDLVSSLVVAESTPAAGPHFPQAVRTWLESWPVPFESREAAVAFFGGDTLWARVWASGLETTTDGLRPRFDVDVMVASLHEIATTSYWADWNRIRAPSLIVRAENGAPRHDVLRMVEMKPNSQLVEIARLSTTSTSTSRAKWREAVDAFLRGRESRS